MKSRPIFARTIIFNDKPIAYFMDDISTEPSVIIYDNRNFIVTNCFYKPDEIINFCMKMEEMGAVEIEV